MNNKKKLDICIALGLLGAFALWTAMVCLIDVQPIGPHGSQVGFATVNYRFHKLTGVHLFLYTLTDWLSLIPVVFAAGFALLGLRQWIQKKQLLKVDHNILALGGFYLLVAVAFVLFEVFPVNYRPILIEGQLEASYPSSTTLLVLSVMPTAAMQLQSRIKTERLKRRTVTAITCFTAFMVIGRLLSGVHWFSDIIGGILLSAGLVMLHRTACDQP